MDEAALARAARFASCGAFESSVLALVPHSATVTGGRLASGTAIAQVVLSSRAGAHSRRADSLAMAWLAALLRACDQGGEGREGAGA